MGQYFILANLDKKEYLSSHMMGSGSKEIEICANYGLANVAMFMMAMGDTDGGAVRGRWAGDRVVLVGDYDKSGIYQDIKEENGWTDVSESTLDAFNDFIGMEDRKIHVPDYMKAAKKGDYKLAVQLATQHSRHDPGWHNEPARHSLAAHGIKTGRSKKR